MEKSRAIELLEHLAWDRDIERNPYGDALNMAIDAIKAQLFSEGTTKDTISRQAAIDAAKDWYEGLICGSINGLIKRLNALPTAQPEPCGDKSYALWKESYEELERRMDELTACSDTISRHATIDAVNNAFDKETLLTGFVRSIALRAIRDMPSVQPEPQEGHWIRTDCGLDVECKCSECGYKDFVSPHDTYWFKRNYCPNCGARMKGERQK